MPQGQNFKLLCYSESKNGSHRKALYFVTGTVRTGNKDSTVVC